MYKNPLDAKTLTNLFERKVIRVEEYDIANLNGKTIEEVRLLEKKLSDMIGEEVVLIAYKSQSEEEDSSTV